jgi:hypothetical protein
MVRNIRYSYLLGTGRIESDICDTDYSCVAEAKLKNNLHMKHVIFSVFFLLSLQQGNV